jgi:hypothetical protein
MRQPSLFPPAALVLGLLGFAVLVCLMGVLDARDAAAFAQDKDVPKPPVVKKEQPPAPPPEAAWFYFDYEVLVFERAQGGAVNVRKTALRPGLTTSPQGGDFPVEAVTGQLPADFPELKINPKNVVAAVPVIRGFSPIDRKAHEALKPFVPLRLTIGGE